MTTDSEQLSTVVPLTSKAGKPRWTTTNDGGRNRNRFNVGHRGGAAKNTRISRERRLHARLSLLAFQRLNQSCLLSTNVGTGTSVHVNIKVVARATCILANQASFVCLIDGNLRVVRFEEKLTTHVNIGGIGTHSTASNKAAFNELVRVMAHNLAVLTGAWLTFIGVNHKVARTRVFFPSRLEHETPFHTRGEASTTSSTNTRCLHLVNDKIVTLVNDVTRAVPVTTGHSAL